MAKTSTKKQSKTAKGNNKQSEPATSPIAQKLGPIQIFDKGFNKGYQNLLVQNVRLTFVRLNDFDVDEENPEKGTKSVTMLIRKNKTNADKLLKFFHLVIQQSDRVPAALKKETFQKIANFETGLFRDGDTYVSKSEGKQYPGTPGHLMLRAKFNAFLNDAGEFASKRPLTLLRANGSEIRGNAISTEFYSGIWADVECSLNAYVNKKGGVGVTCYLGGVMKLLDDESLSQMSSSLQARDDIAELASAGNDDNDVPELDEFKFDE